MSDGALEYLLQPENQDLLARVLTYHVVEGSVTSDQLSTGGVDTLGGGVAVAVRDSGVVVNNASVVNADIQASNGVIHAVNRVLPPETLQQQLASQLGVNSIY
ncbi:MAG: fasciclin domain-containing protein [Nodosilinea sp.]